MREQQGGSSQQDQGGCAAAARAGGGVIVLSDGKVVPGPQAALLQPVARSDWPMGWKDMSRAGR